jgi:hypothetical protein
MSRLDEQHMAAYLERDSMRSRDAVKEMAESIQVGQITPTCDRCGARCEDGHEIVFTGRPEPETGYRPQEVVCVACLEEDGKYDAADAAISDPDEDERFEHEA